MLNKSGVIPLGRAVLLKMDAEEKQKGKIVIPDNVQRNLDVLKDRGTVLAFGPEAWADEKAPRCAPGDRVIVTKMAGYNVQGDDEELYRLVNDRDCFAKLSKQENDNG